MSRVRTPVTSRRAVLGAGVILAGGPAVAAPSASAVAEAKRITDRYQTFGDKASGGPGDTASGEWLEGELKALGYTTARQAIEVPAYEGAATISAGPVKGPVIPQAIVVPTPPEGLSGRVYLSPGRGPGIAVVSLPYGRWSTIVGQVQRRVAAAFERGADAVGIMTDGPSRQACALNTPVDRGLFDRPVFVMSHDDGLNLVAAGQVQGATATLVMAGRSFRRPAFNVTARLDRGAAKTLVLSTPRSGWFACAGERGTGLAAWLMLARWAAAAKLPVNLALIATTGHEYEYAGGEQYIEHVAPKPKDTALWVHFGANVAARDWHERGPVLSPLPSADPQRILMGSAPLMAAAKAAFAGQPGLESPYAIDPAQVAGELASIHKAGYDPVLGIFGTHRYHHTRADDLRCVEPALIPPVTEAMAKVIAAALKA